MTTPDTELGQVRARCRRKLDWQANRARRYLKYYDGEELPPVIGGLSAEEREVFREFRKQARANWSELVVSAVAQRLAVRGFRTGGEASDAAWAVWKDNAMVGGSLLAQQDALVTGQSPVMVQRDDRQASGVSITPESPLEACVLYEPGSRTRRAAGFKRFRDPEDEYGGAAQDPEEWLILPETITRWRGETLLEELPNTAGTVTMLELIPQPRTWGAPRSELKSAIPIQDRVNTTLWDRLVASDFGAYRQVWASGVKIMRETLGRDPETGEDIVKKSPPFRVGVNRLLIGEDPAARFGAIPESELTGYLRAVEQDVQQLAAITQTPPHYLLGQLVNLSADAIKAAEAGLIAKVRARMLYLGECWEAVMRLALSLTGSEDFLDVSVLWRDPETRSDAQTVDALVKLASIGAPREALWERVPGMETGDVERWRKLAAAQQAADAAASAVALGPPVVPVPAE